MWPNLPSQIVSNSGRIFSKLTHRKLPATWRKGEKHDTIIRCIPNRGLPRPRRLPWQPARGPRPSAAPQPALRLHQFQKRRRLGLPLHRLLAKRRLPLDQVRDHASQLLQRPLPPRPRPGRQLQLRSARPHSLVHDRLRPGDGAGLTPV